MKTSSFLLCAIVLLGTISTSTLRASEIQAGLARTDITPPIGGRTRGYSSAQPTDGVHDPVTASVLYLKSKDASVAIVVWDLCVFNSAWLHEQREGLGIDHLLLANTHTHAGPHLGEGFPSEEDPWHREIEKRVLEAVQQAKDNLFPASFSAGEGELQLGYNRLVRQPDGKKALTHFENPQRIPFGPVDPVYSVLRIADDFGKTRAVLVNYACHPVVLGPRNRKISAGFPGVLRKRVEAAQDEGALCLFLQGGAGDINPLIMAREKEDRSGDFELVETLGNLLADEVLKTLNSMQGQSGESTQMLAASKIMTFDHRFESGETLELGVTSILINQEIGLVTMPGEPFHKFQVDLREKADLPHTMFLGYACNGGYPWPSYIPDLQSAARGGYGASDTTRAELGAGERLLNQGLAQLYKMQGRLKDEPVRHLP